MVHHSPSGAAEVFHQPPGGAGAVGCLALFFGPPALGVVGVVYRNFGLVAGVVGVAAVVLALGAAYAFFNEDCTVTLDARGLRLTHRKSFLGLRGPEKLAWEIPRAALTEARELTKYTPGRNGGWSTNKKLHLPHGVVLEPALLGGPEGAAYQQLLASLTRHLGEGFRREDDFGPLNPALKQGAGPPAPPARN